MKTEGEKKRKKSKANEKQLERKLSEELKKTGAMALKFVSPNKTGVPDRIILCNGWAGFAEIKTTGKNLSPRQRIVKKELEDLGFKYFIIDTIDTLKNCIDYVKHIKSIQVPKNSN